MAGKAKNLLDNSEAELPVYTILVPLYKEAEIFAQLLSSLLSLDYPQNKLDIIFITNKRRHFYLAIKIGGIDKCIFYVASHASFGVGDHKFNGIHAFNGEYMRGCFIGRSCTIPKVPVVI